MSLYKVTRDEIGRVWYGRGYSHIIRGARYAVVTFGPGGVVNDLCGTYKSEAAAGRAMRRMARHGTGGIFCAEIVSDAYVQPARLRGDKAS